MNKNQYRIIFNKARGLFMAVAETAKSQGKSTGNSKASKVVTLAAVLVSSAASGADRSQIQVLSTAATNEKPTLLLKNGVAVVDIQTPNAKGVSRNRYSQFDILSGGAVLNNSRTGIKSTLAGDLDPSMHLATGEATVIINEISSTNPTRFEGNLEVAGRRADVIIANPSGLNIKGAGFLNANKATLTTGTIVYDTAKNIDKYQVKQGVINIDQGENGKGLGFDFNEARFVDILASAVNVNANVKASYGLNVVTGYNNISSDLSVITKGGNIGSTPEVKLGITNLGWLYSRDIYLLGTEGGIGVRNAGTIGATHDLIISSEGKIENSGKIITTADSPLGEGILSISTTFQNPEYTWGDIYNSGRIAARNLLLIDAGRSIFHSDGEIAQSNNLTTAPIIISAQGGLYSTNAAKITNSGEGAAISIDTGALKKNSFILSDSTQIKSAGDIYIHSGLNTFLRDSSNITAAGDIDLSAERELAAYANTSMTSSNGNISLQAFKADALATDVVNNITLNGQISAAKDLTIAAEKDIFIDTTLNTGGALSVASLQNLTYIPKVGQKLANTTGDLSLYAEGQLTVSGENLSERVDRTQYVEGKFVVSAEHPTEETQIAGMLSSTAGAITITGGSVDLKQLDMMVPNLKGIDVTAQTGDLNLGASVYLNSIGDINLTSLAGGITTQGLDASSWSKLSILAKGDVNLNSDTYLDFFYEKIPNTDTSILHIYSKNLQNKAIGRTGVNIGSVGDGSLNINTFIFHARSGDVNLLAGKDIKNVDIDVGALTASADNTDYIKSQSCATGPVVTDINVNCGIESKIHGDQINIKANLGSIFLDSTEFLADIGGLSIQAKTHLNLKNSKTYSKKNTEISTSSGVITLEGLKATADGHMAISSGNQLYMNSLRLAKIDANGLVTDDLGRTIYTTSWVPSSSNLFDVDGILSINSRYWQSLKNTNLTAGAINVSSGSGISLSGDVNWSTKKNDLLANNVNLADINGDLSIQAFGSGLLLNPNYQIGADGDLTIKVRDQLKMAAISGTQGNSSAQVVSLRAGGRMDLTAGDMLLEAPKLVAATSMLRLLTTGTPATGNANIVITPVKSTFVNYKNGSKLNYVKGGLSDIDGEINAIINSNDYINYTNEMNAAKNANYSCSSSSIVTCDRMIKAINAMNAVSEKYQDMNDILTNLKQEQVVLQSIVEMMGGLATKGYEHQGALLTGSTVALKASGGGVKLTSAYVVGRNMISIQATGALPAEQIEVTGEDGVVVKQTLAPSSILIDGTSDYYEYGQNGSNNYGFAALQNPSKLSAKNDVKIGAIGSGDLNINASFVNSDFGSIDMFTTGSLALEAVQEDLYRYSSSTQTKRSLFKKKKITTTSELNISNAYGVTLSAEKDINLRSLGNMNLYATNIDAGGNINLNSINGNDLNIYAFKTLIDTTYSTKKTSSFLGIKYKDSKYSSTRTLQSKLPSEIAAQGDITALASGNIVLEGTILKGLGIDNELVVHAGYGDMAKDDATIVFKSITDRIDEKDFYTSNSIVWQKDAGAGSTVDSLSLPKLTGFSSVTLKSPNKIIVDIPEGDFKTELGKLVNDPSYSYLNSLQVRSDVDWNEVKLVFDEWQYEQEGLTPAGAALVAIAVTLATGGAGTGPLGAAMSALQTQAAITLINNKGDLGKTLNDLASSDTIKGMATAALTAGLLDKMGGTAVMQGFSGTGLTDRLVTGIVNSTGSALVNTAVNGGSLSDNLEQALISGTVTALHGALAQEIGGLESQNFDTDYILHKIAHAAAGCLAAAAQQQACEAGAIGAAVGEVVAEMMPEAKNTFYTEEEETKILAASKLITGTIAAYAGYDVNTALSAADTAIQNNRLADPKLSKATNDKLESLGNACRMDASKCAASIAALDDYQNNNKLSALDNGFILRSQEMMNTFIQETNSTNTISFYQYAISPSAQQALGATGAGAAVIKIAMQKCVSYTCILSAGVALDYLQASIRQGNTLGSGTIKFILDKSGIPLTDQEASEAYNAIVQTGGTAALLVSKVPTTKNMAGLCSTGTACNARVLQGDEPLTLTPKIPIIEGRPYPKETAFAQELAAQGNHVIVRGRDAAGADFIINNVKWELKTLESPSVNAVQQNIRKAKDQSDHIFIDGRTAGLTQSTAMQGLSSITRMNRVGSAQTIVVKTPVGDAVWRKDSPVPLTWLPGGVR